MIRLRGAATARSLPTQAFRCDDEATSALRPHPHCIDESAPHLPLPLRPIGQPLHQRPVQQNHQSPRPRSSPPRFPPLSRLSRSRSPLLRSKSDIENHPTGSSISIEARSRETDYVSTERASDKATAGGSGQQQTGRNRRGRSRRSRTGGGGSRSSGNRAESSTSKRDYLPSDAELAEDEACMVDDDDTERVYVKELKQKTMQELTELRRGDERRERRWDAQAGPAVLRSSRPRPSRRARSSPRACWRSSRTASASCGPRIRTTSPARTTSTSRPHRSAVSVCAPATRRGSGPPAQGGRALLRAAEGRVDQLRAAARRRSTRSSSTISRPSTPRTSSSSSPSRGG